MLLAELTSARRYGEERGRECYVSVVAHTFLFFYFDLEFPTDPPQLPSERGPLYSR